MVDDIGTVFRDFNNINDPASGEHEPEKPRIRGLLRSIRNSSGLAVTRNTLAALTAVTPLTEDYMGIVLDDPDPANNGYYSRVAAAWVWERGFPDTFARVTLGGTANAQTGSVAAGVDPASTEVFFATVGTDNTGPMTLSIDGETARDVVNAAGNALSAGEWTGTVMFFVNGDGDYQILFDAGAAAAAAQSATNAAASAVAAAAFGAVNFDDVSDLLADNNDVIGYVGSGASVEVASGFRLSAQGFRYEVAASGATDEHVETAGGVKLYVLGNEVYFDAFAPTKDGVTDDTAVWDKAVSYVSGVKGKLTVAAGDYSIHNGTLKSNVHIEFMPGARLIQPDSVSVDLTSPKVLYGLGTTGTPVDVTADAGIEELTVTVADGDSAGFSVGDYALIYDDDYVFPIPLAGRNEEVVRIAETTSTTITFSKGLTTALTTANNVKIAPLDPIQNLTISGAGEVIVGINRAAGIRVKLGVNCLIKDGVTVRRSRGGGSFVFDTCFNSHINRVSAFDGQSPGTGGTGYGVSLTASCTFCSVRNSHFENLRENTFTNRTRWCVFAGNICVNMIDSGFNTHGAGCDFNVCEGNLFRDCSQAVAISWSGASRGDNDNVVQNNTIEDCNNGVSLSGNATGPILGLRNVAKGNVIKGAVQRGVSISYQEEFSVCGNEILDSDTAGAAGIYATATANDNGMICDNKIRSITGASAFGIRVSGSSNIMVAHNHAQDILGSSAIPYYVPATQTDIRVQLNSLLDCNAESLAGAAVNTLNTWN